MFCKQCGNEVSDGVKFCTSCGAEVSGTNGENTCGDVPPPVRSAGENSGQNMLNQSNRKKKKPIMIAIGVIVAVVLLLALIGGSDPVDTVKDGTFNAYPEQTVGEAFGKFFSNPQWVSYEEGGETYVKFTGGCTLYGEMVNAKIVFLIDGENFNIDTCKIGDVNVTNVYELESILDVIYE